MQNYYCLSFFFALLSEYAGVMAPLIGQERRYDGPMGKSDRAFWLSLIAVIIVILVHTSVQIYNFSVEFVMAFLFSLLYCFCSPYLTELKIV